MPRTYTKKTDRVRTPLDVLTRASEAVAQCGTYTSVAKECSIDRMKLKRFIRKEKLQGPATSIGYEYLSRLKSVFNDRQESDLAEHIKALCNQYYGISVVKCRCLAYEFATKNNVNMPDNWARDGQAGVEWMMSFKRRHGLVIRQPEATSLACATAFNRYVVDQFYDNLATVIIGVRAPYGPTSIWGGRPSFARMDSVGGGGVVAEIFRDPYSVGGGVVAEIFRDPYSGGSFFTLTAVTYPQFGFFKHVLCFARIMSTLCPNSCRQTARIGGGSCPPCPPSRTPMTVMDKYKFASKDIFNVDESGCHIVQTPGESCYCPRPKTGWLY